MAFKTCSKCKRDLEKEDFYATTKLKEGVYPHCKECRKKLQIEYRKNNPNWYKNYIAKQGEEFKQKDRERTSKRYHENLCDMRKYHREYQKKLHEKAEYKEYRKKFYIKPSLLYLKIHNRLTTLRRQFKNNKIEEDIKLHILSILEEGMTLENYGVEWCIGLKNSPKKDLNKDKTQEFLQLENITVKWKIQKC